MNKEIAKKWVAALRSGAYEQGVGRLRRNDKFCCLGVLCNLHAQEHPAIAAQQRSPISYMENSGGLPVAVMEWAGMFGQSGSLRTGTAIGNSGYFKLAAMNDSGCYSFLSIAKAIEENWEKF